MNELNSFEEIEKEVIETRDSIDWNDDTTPPIFLEPIKERAKDFLSCLGNGSTIYQLEAENDFLGAR